MPSPVNPKRSFFPGLSPLFCLVDLFKQLWMGIFYALLSVVLPRSWQTLGDPLTSPPPLRRLQRRSQVCLTRWRTRQQRWWQRHLSIPRIDRWAWSQRFKALGVLSTFIFVFLNLYVFIPPAFAVIAIVPVFTPNIIDPGATSSLTVTIFNSVTETRTDAGLPITLPTGFFIADPENITNTCGGSVSATAGNSSFELSNGTIPARSGGVDGQCTFGVDVTTTVQGNSDVIIPANTLINEQGDPNTTPSQVTLTVTTVTDPSLGKEFSPTTVFISNPGNPTGTVDQSDLIVRITNNATIDLTNVTLTDPLPTGVTAIGINTATKDANCQGGTITNDANSMTLSGVTIAPGATCEFTVAVESSSRGTYNNTLLPGSISTDQGVSNTGNATATLNVQDASNISLPTINTKEFLNDPVGAGQAARLRIQIRNNSNVIPLTGVQLIDIFDNPNIIVSNQNAANGNPSKTGNCQGGSFVDDTVGTLGSPAAGDTFFGITGVTIPRGATCEIQVDVTSNTAGTFPNTIPAGSIVTDLGVTNTNNRTDNLRVGALEVDKQFGNGNRATPGVPLTLTITLSNNSASDLTNANFVDVFTDTTPPLEIANPANASTTCGSGVVTATPGNDRVSLSGGTVPASGSCVVVTDVVVPTGTGQHRNDINAGDVTADGGVENLVLTRRDLTVSEDRVIITKSFQDNPVNINQPATLRLDLNVPNSLTELRVTDLSLVDTLPPGLVIANPDGLTSNVNCRNEAGVVDRSITATPGGNTINLSGVDIRRNQTCRVEVEVVATSHGEYVNDIPANAITTDEGITNIAPTSATLAVLGVTVDKDFTPQTIAPGGRSRLRVTFTNQQLAQVTGVNLTDSFPAGATAIRIANPANATTTCSGGVVSATPGTDNFSLSGGTIPARIGAVPGTCTMSVDVTTSESSGSYTNTIPVSSMTSASGITNLQEASATVNFSPLNLAIAKSFDPPSVSAGTASELKIRLTNFSLETYTDVSFTDNMPTGMQVFAPPNATTTCSGGVVSATSGSGNFSFSGGSIPSGLTCEVTVDVTTTEAGSLVNTIPANGATSFQGATNEDAASATLANLPGVGVAKEFTPSVIEPNGTARLTITFINGDTLNLTDLKLEDVLPAGLEIASPPNASTNCTGGIVTPDVAADPDRLQITGVTLNANSTCQFGVDVTATIPAAYVNTIPAGEIDTVQEATNAAEVTDTLSVAIRPDLTKSFSPGEIIPGGTSTLTLNLSNTNASDITLTSQLVDTLPTNVTVANPPDISGTCTTANVTATAGSDTITYSNGSNIPDGGCTIEVDVTSIVSGTYTNTIPAGGLATTAGTNPNPATDDLIVLTPPSVAKSFSPTSIQPNGTSLLTITLGNVNPSAQTLTADFVDTLPDDVVIATPNNLGGTCPGTVTAVAGTNTITYANGSTIPNGGCTITLNVTAPTQGVKTNTIAAGDLTTNVGSNPSPATADLTIAANPPQVLLVKRITRLNGNDVGFTGVFDDPASTDDNDAAWPSNFLIGAKTTPASPGDEVEYTIYFINTGGTEAQNVRICDPLSEFLTFIPNTYNAGTPTDGGLPTDLGIQLTLGSITPTTNYLTVINDPPDRGRFVNAGVDLTGTCRVRTSDNGTPNNPADDVYSDVTSAVNLNGVVIVDVTRTSGPTQLDAVTAPDPAGADDQDAYGFIRFRARVK